ncbi:hypothetical protein J4Q44_G00337740 [Coregonus suidteri]|uniref:Uncharacterized protein n=1 Tax=Coregonus suidteri TaxID=861788 RepID=A0AAN8QDI3_9TELE
MYSSVKVLWLKERDAKLHGKTVIVTGSNTGIGKMTALDLSRRGARVILACRSKPRAEAALADIKRESGSNEVVFMQLDLGSLKSVRSFAENILKTEPRFDLLINNAGIYMPGTTEDGLGVMFWCQPHRSLPVDQPAVRPSEGVCKLCNVLFTHELAKRLQGTNVTCYTLHPGAINSELFRDVSKVFMILMKPFLMFFFKDTVAGSQTTLHCALQEGLEPFSGRYFSNCTVRNLYANAREGTVAKKLWENTVAGCQTNLHCALQEGLEPLSGRYFSNCTVRNFYPKAREGTVAKKLLYE